MRSIHLPFARWVTSFLSTFFLLLPSAHAARDFMHKKRLRLWFIHVIHRFIHNMLITLFITVDNSTQKIAMLPWNADTFEVPVMWIVWITRNGAQGVDSANSFFIKASRIIYLSFRLIHIVDSTFHQLAKTGLSKELRFASFPFLSFLILTFS